MPTFCLALLTISQDEISAMVARAREAADAVMDELVRDGAWKLETDGKDRVELYHAPDDWAEVRNVAREHPDVVQRLSAELSAWRAAGLRPNTSPRR